MTEAAVSKADPSAPSPDRRTDAPAEKMAQTATTGARARPLLTLKATSGWASLNLHEVWHFRDLILTLAGRDIKVRYKQTMLGVMWVVLQPLLGAGVLSFVFGRVAKLPTDGLPPFLFSFTALLAWNVFNTTLAKTSSSMVGNAHLIAKVYFPRLVLPLSATLSTLIDFGVSMGMMAVLLIVYHTPGLTPSWRLLTLPYWWLLVTMLAMGIGLIAAALMVKYRDVGYVLPVATQLLFYASPIAYELQFALNQLPDRLKPVYMLNPLSGILEAFRWSLLNRGIVTWGSVGYVTVASVASFICGAVMFKRMERNFADII